MSAFSRATSTLVTAKVNTSAVSRPGHAVAAIKKPVQVVSKRASIRLQALPVQEMHTLMELSGDNFHNFLQHTGSNITVVDFFTNWCGPCKCTTPVIERWATQYDPNQVAFAKVDCADDNNKRLAAELGVRALPTFLVYKDGELIAKSTGARLAKLKAIIEEHTL